MEELTARREGGATAAEMDGERRGEERLREGEQQAACGGWELGREWGVGSVAARVRVRRIGGRAAVYMLEI